MRRAVVGIGAASLAALLAACTSSSKKDETPKPRPSPEAVASPTPEVAKKAPEQQPYIDVFDNLDRHHLPEGFPPGRESVEGRMHQGRYASLFYSATRGTVPKHYHEKHEESFFVLDGTGTLLLANRKVRLEPGIMVRVPPGVCHGYEGDAHDPLKALVVLTPPIGEKENDFVAADADAPGTLGTVFVQDVTSPEALPPLPRPAQGEDGHLVTARVLHASRFSTLSVAAVRRDRLPDHFHEEHDEIAVVFAKRGYGFMRIDDVVHIIETGSVMYLPAGSIHSVEHQAEGHLRAVTLHVPAYDGSDKIAIVPDEDPKSRPAGFDKFKVVPYKAPTPPPGYQKTERTGDWVDDNSHTPGGFLRPQRKPVIKGGNDAPETNDDGGGK